MKRGQVQDQQVEGRTALVSEEIAKLFRPLEEQRQPKAQGSADNQQIGEQEGHPPLGRQLGDEFDDDGIVPR